MRILFFCFIFFFFLTSPSVYAQNMDEVRRDLDSLTSANFAGRGYTFEGDKKAANFIRERFKALGVRAFPEKSYYQNFTLPVNTFAEDFALRIDGVPLEGGRDFIARAASTSGKGSAKLLNLLPEYFENPEKHLKKVLKKQKGETYILCYEDSLHDALVQLDKKWRNPLLAQSLALIQCTGKLTHTVATRQLLPPTFAVQRDSFPKNAKSASFALTANFEEAYPTQNVIGYIPGTEDSTRFVMLTAHYDHLGTLGKKVWFPGANDNGVGVAMLLQLAAHYAENPPPYSVAFMAFGAEEAGLVGSRFYTENPYFPLSDIELVFNIDLVGTGEEGGTLVNATLFKKDFKRFKTLNEEHQYLPKILPRGAAANSDHYFFSEKGVKAFFLYLMGGSQAYHDVFDRPEALPLKHFTSTFNLITKFIKTYKPEKGK